jgi:ATP-dependent Clp protease adaptor protein ClpS
VIALIIKATGGEESPLGPDRDTGVLEAPVEPKIKKPPLYRVVLLNDDYTPMEFVVEVLQSFFGLGRERATQVMLAFTRKAKQPAGFSPGTLQKPSLRRSISTRRKTNIR